MPGDISCSDVIDRLPIGARAAVLACIAELVILERVWKIWNTRFAGKPARYHSGSGYLMIRLTLDGKHGNFAVPLAVLERPDDAVSRRAHQNPQRSSVVRRTIPANAGKISYIASRKYSFRNCRAG
jgi:hypothetical protein